MSAPLSSNPPSDHLLRMLAAVPVSSAVLDLACGAGRHTEALLRLGFPVHACDPRPQAVEKTRGRVRELIDAETARTCVQERSLDTLDTLGETFDWIVADRAEAFLDSAADLSPLLATSRRLLEPGGWLYLTVPARSGDESVSTGEPDGIDDGPVRFGPSDLDAQDLDVDLMEARSPTRVDEGTPRIRILYRRARTRTPA